MKLRLVYRLMLLLVLIGLVSSCRKEMQEGEGLSLLSNQEAEKLLLTEQEWRQSVRTRGLNTGPQIIVKAPQLKESDKGPIMEMTVPAELDIVFQENGDPVDMSTLDIVASKGIFSKSLTDRIKPYINGTEIHVKELKIPKKGRFRIKVEISDTGGGKTVENYCVVVKKL